MHNAALKTQNTTSSFVQDLLSKIKRRDEQSMLLLYDEYSVTLYSIINQLLGDRDLADEVLQKTFLKVWTEEEKYETSKGDFTCWLISVARKEAFETLYSCVSKKVTGAVSQLMCSSSVPLQSFFAQLDPIERTIFSLMFHRKLDAEQIASLLKIPLTAIKARMATAHNKLIAFYPPPRTC